MKTMRTPKNFTLIEMLVVIAIIAVLAGLLLPAIAKGMTSAKKSRAKVEIRTLELALKSYETTYGYLPIPKGCNSSDNELVDDATSDKSYTNLLDILTGNNSRGMTFIDLSVPKEYKDPWKNSYVVVFDASYVNKVAKKTGTPGGRGGPYIAVPKSFAIWSIGPDEFDSWGQPSGGRDGGVNDDVNNWDP